MKKKLKSKLLIVTQFFPPDYAATGQLIYELCLDLSQKLLDVEVFTSKPHYAFDAKNSSVPSREIIKAVMVKRSNKLSFFYKRIRIKAFASLVFFLQAFFYTIVKGRRQDIILFTSAPPFLAWIGLINNYLFKTKYICLIYDLYPDIITTLNVLPEKHLIIKLWRKINLLTWTRSSQIIVLDSCMEKRLAEIYPEGSHKISVIHNWSDEKTIVPRSKQDNWFAQNHNLVDQFTVIYSGNMGRCHDMETIVEAAIYLKSEPIKFLMIGNGAQYEYIMTKIAEFQLDNIILLPYQDKEVLPYSLTAGDLTLISIKENVVGLVSPSKLYSCLAAGLPIATISPEGSFLCSLVEDAKCGKNLNNGDSIGLADFIMCLNNNQKLSKQMGKASRDYLLCNFKKEIATSKYYQVITEALV